MAEVLLFHHAQGLTPGVLSFAGRLREAGHTVHVPDLFEGRTFPTVEEGVAHGKSIGFDVVTERGRAFAEGLPEELVYAGFSMGAMPAQLLAETRPGARGALMMSGCVTFTEYAEKWPEGVPAQIHGMDADPWFDEYDQGAAREIVEAAADAELFLYPGDKHLFADDSLSDYDEAAAALLTERVLAFLAKVCPQQPR